MVAPKFEEWVTVYPDVEFVKVDVDDADDVAASCGVQAMPTFFFYKGGDKIHDVVGADIAKLQGAIVQYK